MKIISRIYDPYFQRSLAGPLITVRMFKENHREKNLEVPFSLIIYRGDFMALEENIFAIPAWAFC